nr:MAG: structural polyprotein [Picornavirales sp.]
MALCGALMTTWLPCANQNHITTFSENIHTLSGMHHQILSVPNNNTVCITVPFNTNMNYLYINKDRKNELGTLTITVFSPLLTSTANVTDGVDILVYANFVNVQAIVSTPLSAQSTWGAGTVCYPLTLAKQADEQDEKTVKGIISGPTSILSQAASLVAGIPVISGVASSVSVIADSISSLSAAMGLSKPRNLATTTFTLPRIFANVGYADAQDNSVVLGLNPKNHVVIQPSLFGSNKDELNIAYLSRQPTMLFSTHWDVSHKVGTSLISLPVHPYIGNKQKEGNLQKTNMTHMGYLASVFTYWRGSITFTFEIFSTSMHAGQLVVGFIPKGSWSAQTNFPFETTIKKKIHVTGEETRTVESFTVPFISSTMMNQLMTPFSEIDYTSDVATGALIVKVAKPLVTTSLASEKIYINIWVQAGDDFELALPDLNKLKIIHYGGMKEESDQAPDLLPTASHRPDLINGESILNIRQLLKISTLKYYSSFSLSPGHNQIHFPAHSFTGSQDANEIHDTYYAHFMRLYRYSRGSIRHKVMFKSFEGKASAIMSTSHNIPYRWTTKHTLEGAPWCTTHSKLAPFLEYEIPYYSNLKAQVHGEYPSRRSAIVQLLSFEDEMKNVPFTLYESIGDDFSAGYLMGVPPLFHAPGTLERLAHYILKAKTPPTEYIDGHYKYGGTKSQLDGSSELGMFTKTPEIVQQWYYTSYMLHRYTLLTASGTALVQGAKIVMSDSNLTGFTRSGYVCFIDKEVGAITKTNYTWPVENAYNGVWFYINFASNIYMQPCKLGGDLRDIRVSYPREDIFKILFDSKPPLFRPPLIHVYK